MNEQEKKEVMDKYTPKVVLLDHYQKLATIQEPRYKGEDTFDGLVYTVLGLNGEAGEVAEKIKKLMREGIKELTEEDRQELKKELGDVFWYLANTAKELNFRLSEIASFNVEKLADRAKRGRIFGNGDNR